MFSRALLVLGMSFLAIALGFFQGLARARHAFAAQWSAAFGVGTSRAGGPVLVQIQFQRGHGASITK
jgi:hypothetical protein